jgi:hypothetical protein
VEEDETKEVRGNQKCLWIFNRKTSSQVTILENLGIKCKGKLHPRMGNEGPEGEYRYSFTLALTSSLDGVGGQRHAPIAVPPGKTPYPLYRRLGEPQDRSGRLRKFSLPSGFGLRTVQPVAGRCTDCAIPALEPRSRWLNDIKMYAANQVINIPAATKC